MRMKTPNEAFPCQYGDALVIVDVQNDFLPPHGALAVPEGNQVVQPLNHVLSVFKAHHLPVYATRDWHPLQHCSFRDQGGPWPPHCVAGTFGSEFYKDLNLPQEVEVISKATSLKTDAYSGFEGTDLAQRLKSKGIERVIVGGLATDYCVVNTVRDALKLGFQVFVMEDCIRAVNVQPEDGARAVEEMVLMGASLIHSHDLV